VATKNQSAACPLVFTDLLRKYKQYAKFIQQNIHNTRTLQHIVSLLITCIYK